MMSKPIYISLQRKGEAPPDKENREEPGTNETIYCQALAETLHHIALPVTVGLYAPWGRGKKRLLCEIEDHMRWRSKQNGSKAARTTYSLPLFLWHIIFAHPLLRSAKPEGIHYIFINFNAWEYAGCDHTWAGIVTTLLDEIEGNYRIPFSTFRSFGVKLKEEPVMRKKKWALKGWSKLFWFGLLCLFLGLFLSTVLTRLKSGSGLWESVAYTTTVVLGTSTLPFMRCTRNIFFTLKKKLQAKMNAKDQLGFMHFVKEEVKTITHFLQFMAFEEDREIRVVLKIVNLDLCTPDKVVAVLDAIKILLSDEDAPYITILVADPGILVDSIQSSKTTCSNGYLYLNRIISLPFSLPRMSCKGKRQMLAGILNRKRKRGQDSATNPETWAHKQNSKEVKEATGSLATEEVQHIFQDLSHENFEDYVPGNFVQMNRVVNTVLTIRSMLDLGYKPQSGLNVSREDGRLVTKEVVDWVILAHFWPCRLSWILQCAEDEQQEEKLIESRARGSQLKQGRGRGGGGDLQDKAAERESKALLPFYEDNALELDKIKNDVRKLLELDGDPDLFRTFLQKTHFTVGRARYFSNFLINLDFSLKRQFELQRGLNHIVRRKNREGESPSAEKSAGLKGEG
ncbi:NTPase KAP family P-loop domain-containing protein 1-like isoform X1 [Podarcis raffonei]|uniref:NTPase KAP family P-loop domain-containing protein 1-like isoform X1 n=2 Tax=Podarcis raffonei TaxID=65483 RepID=UPI0023290B65|nr:NTPase KAP family P-loop domain-containing protein 1-like isoform X1 [Podarcis raffonei]